MIKENHVSKKFVYTLKFIVFKNIKLWKHGLFLSQKLIFKESFDVFKFTFIWW